MDIEVIAGVVVIGMLVDLKEIIRGLMVLAEMVVIILMDGEVMEEIQVLMV